MEASQHQLRLLSLFLFKGVSLNSSSCQLPSGLGSFLVVNCADTIDWEDRPVAQVLICRKAKRKKERKINPFIIYKPDITNITSKLFVKLAKHACLMCRLFSISWSCYGQDMLQKQIWDVSSLFPILFMISVILFFNVLRRQKSFWENQINEVYWPAGNISITFVKHKPLHPVNSISIVC